jgi:outer membrane protein assembly factor BamB
MRPLIALGAAVGLVFVTCEVEKTVFPEPRWSPATIMALDPATGAEVWRAEAPFGLIGGLVEVNGSLLTYGNTHCNGGPGDLAVLDTSSGDVKWSGGIWGDGRCGQLRLTPGESAIAVCEEGFVSLLDLTTGAARWKSTSRCSGGGVMPSDPVTSDHLVISSEYYDGIHAFDPMTGAERWYVPIERGRPIAVNQDLALILTERQLIALRTSDGAELWRIDGAGGSHVLMYEELVVMTRKDDGSTPPTSHLDILDAGTGTLIRSVSRTGEQESATIALSVENGYVTQVLSLGTRPAVFVHDLSSGIDRLENFWLSAIARRAIAAGDRLFFTDEQSVQAMPIEGGAPIWRREVRTELIALGTYLYVAVDGETIYVGE